MKTVILVGCLMIALSINNNIMQIPIEARIIYVTVFPICVITDIASFLIKLQRE